MLTTIPLLTALTLMASPLSNGVPSFPRDHDPPADARGDGSPLLVASTPAVPEGFEPPWCRTWYPDCDADGFGDPSAPYDTCVNPNLVDGDAACTYRRNPLDCDDHDPEVNPLAAEDISDPPDGVDNDCDGTVDIDCDGTSTTAVPWIRLVSPARGLFTAGDAVEVSGVVYPSLDRTPITTVTVGGVDATVTACSQDGGLWFEATVPLDTGVHTIDIRATDEQGNNDRALTSYARSDTFLPLHDGAKVSGSLVTLLNQGTWDILGEYLESLLSAEELQAELLAANPLVSESGSDDCLESYSITANATGYTHDDVDIDFVVTGGHIVTTARLVHPQMWASGTGYYDLEWYCGGWDDTVGMTGYVAFSQVVATANAWLALNDEGMITVTFTDIQVDAQGVTVDVGADDWFYDWLIDLFESDMEDELERFIEDELYDYVANDLGPDLAEELNSLDMDTSLDVDGTTYAVAFDYDTLDVVEGSVALGFGISLSYTSPAETPDNPGMVIFPPGYTLDASPTFGLAVSADFFNAALHALWEGGHLNLSNALWSDPAVYGVATPLLPPVIGPSSDGYLLALSLGDILVGLQVTGADGEAVDFDVALSATVQLDIDPVCQDGMIGFDLMFAPADISYDLLGEHPIPAEFVEATEGALETLANDILAELEPYLESLEISYLDLPLEITDMTLDPDAGNPAMLLLSGQAVYTGH